MRFIKKLEGFILFIVSLILFTNFISVVYADALPVVLNYKMVSTNAYMNYQIEEQKIGIIVRFDSLDQIVVNSDTTYAEVNFLTEGGDHTRAYNVSSITLENEEVYTPAANELLFEFEYSKYNCYLEPGSDSEVYMLKVINIVINQTPNISVNMEPLKDYRVYRDIIEPELDSVSIVENENNDAYNYNDTIKIELHFDEPIVIKEENMREACKFNIENLNGEAFTDSFTSYSVNDTVVEAVYGSDVISLSYKITELRADYGGVVRIYIDYSKVTDIAGNEIGSSGYFDVDNNGKNIVINSVYPKTEDYSCEHDNYIRIFFKDDDFSDTTGEAGVFLSEYKIDDIENINFEAYSLMDLIYPGYTRRVLGYDAVKDRYSLMFYTSDDAFSKADDNDKVWYFYYYLTDKDGNKAYYEIKNILIDRKTPDISFSGNYLIPAQNQQIEFEIRDRKLEKLSVAIKDMNGEYILRQELLGGDTIELDSDIDYLYLEEAGITNIKGKIDVGKMYEKLEGKVFDTETYQLVFGASGSYDHIYSKNSILFTIDKTAPTLTIDTIEGEQGAIKAYSLKFEDINGQEVLDPGLIETADKKVTLFYHFVKTGLSEYADADQNEQVISAGQSVEVMVPYNKLTPGTYCLNIKGVDTAGNKVTELSTKSFEILDNPSGTIECYKFTNSNTLSVNFNLSSTSNNLVYRTYLDDADPENWPLANQNWHSLANNNGTGTFPINVDDYDTLVIEGEHTLYFQYGYEIDDLFYESYIISDAFIFDVTGPTAVISYSTEETTYEPVTATLTEWSDNYSSVENISLISNYDEVRLSTSGDTYTFILKDEAGNTSEFVARAEWISSEAKPATIVYSTTAKTKEDVTVYLDFEAMDNNKAQITLQMDGINPSSVVETTAVEGYQLFTFKENGNYTFEYLDDKGKTGYVTAYISNIDSILPTAEVSFSDTSITNKNVYGYIKPKEAVNYKIYDDDDQLLEDKKIQGGEIIEYLFTQNGTITVLLVDKAGNQQSYSLLVDWIDKTPPVVFVEYSDNYYEASTKKAVTVTVSAYEPIFILNNYQETSRIFVENGEYTFFVEDYAGNRADIAVSVTNISKSNPVLTLTYSSLGPTNENVLVTLSSDQPVTILNNNGSNELVFTQNGKKYFKVEDASGGIIYQFTEVTWIDKAPPAIKFDQSSFLYTTIGGSIDLDSDFSIEDDVDGEISNYTINHNINLQAAGTYFADYTFTDKAGNKVTVRRAVEVLSNDKLTILINGIKATDELLIIYEPNLKIEIYNTSGTYELQYKKGMLKTGNFKKNKQFIENDNVVIDRTGYITFYIQDQERNWDLVHCYVYK